MDRELGPSIVSAQVDEIWGYVGKKQRQVQPEDNPNHVGLLDLGGNRRRLEARSLLGKRDAATAQDFIADLASRLSGRALRAYVDAIDMAFRMWISARS